MPSDADFPNDLQILESDYELIREIGQGGMAAVYLARHRASGKLVAIKAIRARYVDDPDAIQRFAREARTVAELDHPNIVCTEAIEQIGDRAVAIIMEYIEGGTVRDRLREYGPFAAERAESVLRDVANALGYAHRRGIVHRDVKPENVFLDATRGRAVLSDFGIARKIDSDASLTLLGAALGTPQYMSPEQIDGGKVDGRSDIYSLGVLGWELLTGRRPWAGESLYGIIYRQKHEDLPRITSIRPRVPANLLFAIEGALVKDRALRWQSTDEFLEHLTYDPPPVLAQAPVVGASPPVDEPTITFRRESSSFEPVAVAPNAVPTSVTSAPREPAFTDGHSADDDRAEQGAFAATRRDAPKRPEGQVARAPRRWRAPRWGIRQMLALLVPLAIAGTAFYVVFGGRMGNASSRDGPVQSSAGSIASDTVRSTSAPPASRAAPAPPVSSPTPSAADTQTARTGHADTSGTAKAATASAAESVRARSDVGRRDSTRPPGRTAAKDEDPFRPPTAVASSNGARAPTTPASGAGPSPRCQSASMADQTACLLAYISVNDAMLQRVYDSLIVEQRRIAGVGRGAADPASVTRLRVEQRTWIGERDRECMRQPVPRTVPLWAEPLSKCFADMSGVREAELRERLERARRQRR
jgi:serine/threonine protein kinase/uncharacterized protein YecT (DUF1311 family)